MSGAAAPETTAPDGAILPKTTLKCITTFWMQGRVKRKQGLRELEERTTRAKDPEQPICALCGRTLGTRVEWHHPVPKSEGGTNTVPVHPICHRAIHAHISNHDLAERYADLEALRTREDIQRFLRWIANKPPDFHAPTRKRQMERGDDG